MLAAAGCGGDDGSPGDTRDSERGTSGRPLGSEQAPQAEVVAATVGFSRGYFQYLEGRRTIDAIPHAAQELRRSLRRQRVPLGGRARRSAVARAVVDRLSADSARVTVTVNNVTEGFSYPLPLDLVRRGRAWLVLTLPDDT